MIKRLGRKLTDGLAARLEFDYACNRGHSFGEYYLHGTVNEIISANIDPSKMRVHAGYAHRAIAREKPGRGRQPELDFYVKSRAGTLANVCAEVKWADSSHAKAGNVLRDLLRLALVKQSEPSTECLFILAGRMAKVESLLSTPPVAAASKDERRLLEYPRAERAPRKRAFPLVVDGESIESISKGTERFSGLPETIHTTLVTPTTIGTKRWQALVWRVTI